MSIISYDKKNIIYILVFVFALQQALALYINSSFLKQFIDDSKIGLVFSFSSLLTIIILFFIRRILRKNGNYKTILIFLSINLLGLLLLILSKNVSMAILAYSLTFISHTLIYFNFDVFLENLSTNEATGHVRGLFLTSTSLAFIIGPLITSSIIDGDKYYRVYTLSFIILLIVFFLIAKNMRSFKDPIYKNPNIFQSIKKVYNHCNLYGIFFSTFILNLFYSCMIIYTPVYLYSHIGFSLPQTTLIIAMGLIPFVLLQGIWGWLADTKIGEKEILTAGFIITASATATMTFISTPSIALWATVLFVTRIGASMIESMTETYLFKKIDSEEIDVLSLFRIVRPVAYIVGPLLASLLLAFIDFKFLFLILGTIVLYGVRFSLAIRDTR